MVEYNEILLLFVAMRHCLYCLECFILVADNPVLSRNVLKIVLVIFVIIIIPHILSLALSAPFSTLLFDFVVNEIGSTQRNFSCRRSPLYDRCKCSSLFRQYHSF